MHKKKNFIIFLAVMYLALLFNTGHLCFCHNINPETGICSCCHNISSNSEKGDCDCCINIKTNDQKLSIEPNPFGFDFTALSQNTDHLFPNLYTGNKIKEPKIGYTPAMRNTDLLKTVILLN